MVTLQFSYCELATLFFWYKASVFTGPSQSHYINSHVTVSVSYAADIWNSSSFSNYFCSFWDFSVWGISLLNHGADLLTVETSCKFHQVMQKLPVVSFVRIGS